LPLLLFTPPPPPTLYTLSLHDALPIFASSAGATFLSSAVHDHKPTGHSGRKRSRCCCERACLPGPLNSSAAQTLSNQCLTERVRDRKSTRLNSSHVSISYAVFCLKKKK